MPAPLMPQSVHSQSGTFSNDRFFFFCRFVMNQTTNTILPAENYSISDIERDTGLSKMTLRMWEHRYGFPNPQRDAQGNRSYLQSDLDKLVVIKRLLVAGYRPSKVARLSLDELHALSKTAQESGSERHSRKTKNGQTLDIEWIQWLKDNESERFRRAVQQQLVKYGLAATIENIISPLAREVGVAWMHGELSVFQEHLFTETIQGILRDAMTAIDIKLPDEIRTPRVLLTTLPQEKHTLGLLMAECFFALENCERLSLGADTPLSEILAAAGELNADIVAIGVSTHAPVQEVIQNLKQLRQNLPVGTELWMGGNAALFNSKRLPANTVFFRKAQDIIEALAAWRAKREAI